MAIEDKDLLKIICEIYPDQPLSYVMDQFKQAKAMCISIEQSFNSPVTELAEALPDPEEVPVEAEAAPEAPRKKRITRRNLVCKPEEAITDDSITCCVCGRKVKSITSKHLAAHGMSVEEYKKVCGYAPEQKLMSNVYAAKMVANIKAAQEARELKRMESQYAAENSGK